MDSAVWNGKDCKYINLHRKWWVDMTGMAEVGMTACGFEEKLVLHEWIFTLKWEKCHISYKIIIINNLSDRKI